MNTTRDVSPNKQYTQYNENKVNLQKSPSGKMNGMRRVSLVFTKEEEMRISLKEISRSSSIGRDKLVEKSHSLSDLQDKPHSSKIISRSSSSEICNNNNNVNYSLERNDFLSEEKMSCSSKRVKLGEKCKSQLNLKDISHIEKKKSDKSLSYSENPKDLYINRTASLQFEKKGSPEKTNYSLTDRTRKKRYSLTLSTTKIDSKVFSGNLNDSLIEKLETPYQVWLSGYRHIEYFYQLLFKPFSNLDMLREDFFIAYGWIKPIAQDLKSESPRLVNIIEEAYKNAGREDERIWVLNLVEKMIEKKVLGKEKLGKLFKMMKDWHDPRLNYLQNEVVSKSLRFDSDSPSKDIDLIEFFQTIAQGKDKNNQKIIKNLCKSLIAGTIDSFNRIDLHEFHDKAWESEEEMVAPHIKHMIYRHNCLSSFMKKCILKSEDVNGRILLYRAILDMVRFLIKKCDYENSNNLLCTLQNWELSRTIPNDCSVKNEMNELLKLFEPIRNFGKLRQKIKEREEKKITHIPPLHLYFHDLLLNEELYQKRDDEGKIIDDNEGEIHISKLKSFADIQRKIQNIQYDLSAVKTENFYNLEQIFTDTLLTQEELNDRSQKLFDKMETEENGKISRK